MKRFVIFFLIMLGEQIFRRLISARILYQHLTGLGVLSPKLNCKFFVKIYIITYPARFHSNHAVMKP